MKKTWKKLLAAGCAATMLMTMPGICVQADEMAGEELIITEAEVPDTLDSVDSKEEDVADDADSPTAEGDISQEKTEEVVGIGPVQVGDGVTATFDKATGTVEFTSQNGELSRDWRERLGINSRAIESIRVASGTVYLPADSSGYDYDYVYHRYRYYLFGGLTSLDNLDLSGFDTSNVTDMSYMFDDCMSLDNLDLSGFDTSNVTDMMYMFSGCYYLRNLDLRSFDTSNVTDMYMMFWCCEKLTSLDLSSFDTSNVTNMYSMFSHNRNLINLDLSGFDTSNVQDMSGMFDDCIGLQNLNLSDFDTSNVTNMRWMFSGCSKLASLDLSSFDTSNVTDMNFMFQGCSSLRNLDLSSFDMSNLNTLDDDYFSQKELFECCSGLVILKTPKKNVLSVPLPAIMYDKAGNEYEALPALTKSITLTRKKVNISDCKADLSAWNYIYDGEEKKPTVTVEYGNTVLISGTEYTWSYADNINAGTATVKVFGTGNYKGEKYVTFNIDKDHAKLFFAESAVKKETTDAAFTIALTKTTDGTVTFKSSNTKVATVDSASGLVNIKGAGETTITASAAEGTNYMTGSASYTLTVTAPAPAPAGFSDVQDLSHPYYNAIYWAADAGITKGYADGTFGINRDCTRGEMIMFLWRFAGKPLPKAVWTSPFKDVPMSHSFFKAILWAYQTGITKGYSDGTFGINRNVSRGECMMFLWRIKGKPAPKSATKSPFKDVPMTHAFYKAILWGSQKGVTKGYTSGPKKGNFGINDNCTRGQIVTFLYRAKDL